MYSMCTKSTIRNIYINYSNINDKNRTTTIILMIMIAMKIVKKEMRAAMKSEKNDEDDGR